MKLLIDIGNTRLKWMLYQDADTVVAGAWPHEDVLVQIAIWQAMEIEGVWLASVGQTELTQAVTDKLESSGYPVHRVETQPEQAGVKNAYSDYRKLGVDRWLGLLAARQQAEGRAIVASAGTAMTVDVLERDGQHLGGLILPGLRLMRDSLNKGTELLPLVDGGARHLGQDTEQAIENGTLGALVCTFESVLAQYLEGEQDMAVIAGGDAELVYNALSPEWRDRVRCEPDWLFLGLLVASGE